MTIAGVPTVSDVQDLLAAKDYQVGQVQSVVVGGLLDGWLLADSDAATSFLADWNAFQTRYTAARDAALATIKRIDFSIAPNALTPDSADWNAILDALSPGRPAATQTGSFQDLVNRLDAAGASIDMSATPQPASTDLDLETFQATDAALAAGKKLAGITGQALTTGGITLGVALAGAALLVLAVRR